MLWWMWLGCQQGPRVPIVGDAVQVVPGDGLPEEVVPQPANNNLDVAWHDGRVFLAFRTAPNHFASDQTELYVVSSEDQVSWRYEGHFATGRDVREPQLISHQGTLHLWFAELGTNPLDFEPGGSFHTVYNGPGDWTDPEPAFPLGTIPWRIKPAKNGGYWMLGYRGGENVYDFVDPEPVEVLWLHSDDLVTWEPTLPGFEVVRAGGASEIDLEMLDDGSIVAVLRNEAGEDGVFGSFICTAPAANLTAWTCAADPRKYDSPLLIQHAGEIWLVGRRNVTETGAFDLDLDIPVSEQVLRYQADYWGKPKRCAIWRVLPEERRVEHVVDLASAGDTCFPEALPMGVTWRIYNYTSPLDGRDPGWLEGQNGPTHIVYQDVDFVLERYAPE